MEFLTVCVVKPYSRLEVSVGFCFFMLSECQEFILVGLVLAQCMLITLLKWQCLFWKMKN